MTEDAFVDSETLLERRSVLGQITPWGVECARTFYEAARALCVPDQYNLVLHKHLGDIVNTLAAKDIFEKKYGSKLRPIVRPQHEFLIRMFEIEDYAILDIDGLVKKNKHLLNIYFGTIDPPRIELDRLENRLFQALFSCMPIKSEPFVCETLTDDFLAYNRYWAFRWAENLGLDPDFKLPLFSRIPSLSDRAMKALSSIGPLDKIVLFAPEAATAAELRSDFWNIIADEVTARGYKIIVNSKRFNIRNGYSAFDFGLSLEDVVALGYSCAFVFSVRSGLCDVLAGAGKRLYSFYPAMLRREMNGLNRSFAADLATREIGIEAWKIDRVIWDGVDLTPALQDYVDGLQKEYKRAELNAKFSTGMRKLRLLRAQDRLRNQAGAPYFFPQSNHDNPPRPTPIRFLGVPIGELSFHKEDSGNVLRRRKFLSGLVVIDERWDGTWKSKLANRPLSAGTEGRKITTQRMLDELDGIES